MMIDSQYSEKVQLSYMLHNFLINSLNSFMKLKW